MSTDLTATGFAAMMLGAPAIPLCEHPHRCGRVATNYLEARHHCLIPRGHTGKYFYPVCFGIAVSTVANARYSVTCPVCGDPVPQRDYTRMAGVVDVRI